jgi:hypothetical protein
MEFVLWGVVGLLCYADQGLRFFIWGVLAELCYGRHWLLAAASLALYWRYGIAPVEEFFSGNGWMWWIPVSALLLGFWPGPLDREIRQAWKTLDRARCSKRKLMHQMGWPVPRQPWPWGKIAAGVGGLGLILWWVTFNG